MRQTDRQRYPAPLVAALLVVSVGATPVPAVMASEEAPCLEEIEKYCNHLKPGEGILNCLREHERDLSSVCRDKLAANSRRLLEGQKICAKDIESFCRGVVPGGGRIYRCLNGHLDELTSNCRDIVSGWKKPAADQPAVKQDEQPAGKPAATSPAAPGAR